MAIIETVKGFTKVAGKWIVKYAPQILTTGGVLLMSTAVGTGIMVTPEAKAKLDAIENDQTLSHTDAFKKKATVIVSNYWPTLALAAGGAALIFCGQHVSLSRLGTATALLATRTDELKKLEQKIIEKDGQKKFESYKDEIAQEEVKKEAKRQNIESDISLAYNTGHGSMLCYDPNGRRFFLSDIEFLRRSEREFNAQLCGKRYSKYQRFNPFKHTAKSLNDWYEYIDLPKLDGKLEDPTTHDMIQYGANLADDIGWKDRAMELNLVYGKLPNDTPYLIMGFTEDGAPGWCMNISDYDNTDVKSGEAIDDETDMPWR